MRQVTLFCLPYAGGSASIYRDWAASAGAHINLVSIELPGRGRRFNEAFSPTLDDAVNDILTQIQPHLDGSPIALFGHSMGGILAFELAYKLVALLNTHPCHLFFAGCEPPHLRVDDDPIHSLPDKQFLEAVNDLGGTPNSFFDQPELMDLFLPILRNDFKVIENYRYKAKPMRLSCDISLLYGEEEGLHDIIDKWRDMTDGSCHFQSFPGDHFFINEKHAEIMDVINQTLEVHAFSLPGTTCTG